MVTKGQIVQWLENVASVFNEQKDYLVQLDSAIGDADHGINMARGFNKVMEKLPGVADKDIGNILKAVGMMLVSTVGGASGPLYGTFFLRAGMTTTAREELSNKDLYQLLEAGVDGILQRGRPNLGDKTMYDTWAPALKAYQVSLEEAADTLSILRAAVAAAEQGMLDTIPMQARKGRASYLGERSIGHQDPGATSSYLMLKTLLQTVENDQQSTVNN